MAKNKTVIAGRGLNWAERTAGVAAVITILGAIFTVPYYIRDKIAEFEERQAAVNSKVTARLVNIEAFLHDRYPSQFNAGPVSKVDKTLYQEVSKYKSSEFIPVAGRLTSFNTVTRNLVIIDSEGIHRTFTFQNNAVNQVVTADGISTIGVSALDLGTPVTILYRQPNTARRIYTLNEPERTVDYRSLQALLDSKTAIFNSEDENADSSR